VWPTAGRCITMDGFVVIVQQFVNQFTDAKYQVLKICGSKYILKYK
jgi:hypothetical protein